MFRSINSSVWLGIAIATAISVMAIECTWGRQVGHDSGASEESRTQSENLTPGLTPEMISDGWLSLFDGKTLFGWVPRTKADWTVSDGTIKVQAGEPGLLTTSSQFDDFELRVEFKSEKGTNSGIFLRTSPHPKKVGPGGDCYEVNIAAPNADPFPTGSLVDRSKSKITPSIGKWHRMRVVAKGDSFKVWINGSLATSYKDPKPLGRGYIGFQFKSGEICFRHICLKPLGTQPIFNGKNLDGWNSKNKLASEFSVNDRDELWMKNGKGQLESNKQFGDFVFSMKCKTNGKGLNSGIFFRCIPGDVMNGYESQIQNQMKDKDPTKPFDCGTGGIFRRQNARRIVAEDQKWFSKTIVAIGPHIAVWVNGYQVSDWSDRRKPAENPRKGLRLDKGTFCIQGHDPTTDILFKDIRANELAPRR